MKPNKNKRKRAQLQRSLEYANQQIEQSEGTITMLKRAQKRHIDARDKIQEQIKKIDNPEK